MKTMLAVVSLATILSCAEPRLHVNEMMPASIEAPNHFLVTTPGGSLYDCYSKPTDKWTPACRKVTFIGE